MDVTGQSGSTTPANGNGRHGEGYPANGWGESWSGAGSALEPEPDSVVPAWRRGMDALSQSRAQTPPRYAEILADAGVRPTDDQEPDDHRLFEAPDIADPPEFVPLPQDMFDGLPDDDLLGTGALGGPFGGPLGDASGALTEATPAQGTPSLFSRLLDIPTVPSAPPAPRASTYPVQPAQPVPPSPPAVQPVQPIPPGQPVQDVGPPPVPPGLAAQAGPPMPPAHQAPLTHQAQPLHQAQPIHHAPLTHHAQPTHQVQPIHQAPLTHQAPPVHQAPPAPPGLRPTVHAEPAAPVSGPAYAPVSGAGYAPVPEPALAPVSAPAYAPPPSAYGGPSLLTPPGGPASMPGRPATAPGGPPAHPGGPAVIRPAVPQGPYQHPAHGDAWGSQSSDQHRRAPQAPPDPGFEEPELEAQVDQVEQQRRADHAHGLPQRVPAEPDVPGLAEQPPATEPPAPAPVLSRVASGLRRDDLPPAERPDAFDVAAVLSAVRDVPGVKDAQLRATATGGHTLRLDLADGSDPAYVSRVVARMLNERMGLVAEPPAGAAEVHHEPEPPPRPVAPTVPMQGGGHAYVSAYSEEPPTGRVPVPPSQRSAPPLPPGLIPASSAPREPRRRHPVTMRGRYPSDLRPGGLTSNDRVDSDPGRPPALPPPTDTRRVVLDHVQVSTFGLDATVEVRLVLGDRVAMGVSNGPAVDGYILRLSAAAAANAVDELLGDAAEGSAGRGHCYVEQASIVPMGSCEVAVVVVLLVCEGWVEQLAGSAVVSGDPRQAVVRATLAAVNRRLTALLP